MLSRPAAITRRGETYRLPLCVVDLVLGIESNDRCSPTWPLEEVAPTPGAIGAAKAGDWHP